MAKHLILIVAAAGVTAFGACDRSARDSCVWLGVCDSHVVPERVVVLCDHSAGSSCSVEALDSTVAASVRHIVKRPGSNLEVWMVGQDLAQTRPVARFSIAPSRKSGLHAIGSHQSEQIRIAQELIRQRSKTYIEDTPPSRSPLLGALGKVSLTRSDRDGTLHIVLVSDALQFGEGWDWECRAPQDPEQLLEVVRAEAILPEGSLTNTSVIFAWVRLDEIDGGRCPVEIGAARRVRELWEALLTSAGAHSVTFEAGPPSLDATHAKGRAGDRP